MVCIYKNASASGGLCPPDPMPGLCPWTPLGDCPWLILQCPLPNIFPQFTPMLRKTSFYWKRCNTVLPCRLFPELRSLSYITGWKSWSCGRLKNRETGRIWSNCTRSNVVLLQNFFTLAPHSWKLVKPHSGTVALMQGNSSFLFESSTNGTVFHKRQLMPALWTCSRTS